MGHERQPAEESPEEALSRLEEKLAAKSRALEASYEEFQSLIYAISHDFKAPMRGILASCTILREDFGPNLGLEGQKELERQAANVQKLNALIEQLLRLSRVGSHEFKAKPVQLKEIAQRAAEDLGPEVLEALQVPQDRTLLADPTLLHLAFKELFDNACKFARPEMPLQIRVLFHAGKVEVHDNGTGFDSRRVARVFMPLERLCGNEIPGWGMGLALAKRAIDRHGGEVGCTTQPGQGATFWFTLGET